MRSAVLTRVGWAAIAGWVCACSPPRERGSDPILEAVVPASGPSAGGTSVRIEGSDLDDVASVHFGTRVAWTSAIADGEIQAIAPGGPVGWVDVSVRTADGVEASLPIAFGFDMGGGPGRFRDETASRIPADAWTLQDVAVGDCDGDGDVDVVLAGYFETQDRFLRNEQGVLRDVTLEALPTDTSQDVHPELADLDGDGDLDIYMAAEGADRVLINDGAARWSDETEQRLPPSGDMSEGADVGDVDGDGDLDVVVANLGSGERERLLINDGRGVFEDETAARLPDVADPSYTSELVDLDGDGDLDLAIANYGTASRILLNDGEGVFVDGDPLPGALGYSTALVAGDVDADGDADLYEARFMGLDRLLLNDGDARFVDASSQLPAVDGNSYDAKLADLDEDGDLDVAVARTESSNLILLNDGAGQFSVVAGTPTGDDRSYGVAVADLTGDGALDLVFSSWGGEQTLVWVNAEPHDDAQLRVDRVSPIQGPTTGGNVLDVRGSGFIGELGVEIGGQPLGGIEVIDATWIRGTAPPGVAGPVDVIVRPADGDPQTLVAGYAYVEPGAGPFMDATEGRLPQDAGPSADVRVADLTGDGHLDVFVAREGERNLLYVGDGSGAFVDETTARLPADVGVTQDVVASDVDGDGDLDLVLARDDGVFIWHQDAGTFSVVAEITELASATTVRVGDLVEDERADVFVVRDGEPDALVVATAEGWDVRPIAVEAGAGVDGRLADFDGDGHLDVIVVRLSEADYVLFGDGLGGFERAEVPDDPALLSYAVAVGDVDADGLPDIVVGVGGATSRNRLWRSLGRTFEDITESHLPEVIFGTSDILLTDLDADDDLDIVEVNWWGPNWLYVNDDTGVFSPWSALPEIGDAPSVAADVGDVDGNGSIDIVVAAAGERTRLFLTSTAD